MSTPLFHDLPIHRVQREADDAVAITLAVPPALRDAFAFTPGQYLTLRATFGEREERRSYSICSPRARFVNTGEIDIGIKPVEGGVFSTWAARQAQAGLTLQAMAPQGRFTPRVAGARHRVGFAAGSGITPLLSIIASTLAEDADSQFTLVYGNRRVGSILFSEALQDLKDRYPARLTLIHVLSRQPQEVPLLHGRLDIARVAELLRTLVPADRIDEAFVCGPAGMIDDTERALREAGVAPERIHTERFFTEASAPQRVAAPPPPVATDAAHDVALEVVQGGKTHSFTMTRNQRLLDVALDGGLDLPWSCRAGVCCTCRARVLEGEVTMERNFTLEPQEVASGFVLTCQARPLTARVVVSYDER